jgi:hypothetical protein
VKLAQDLVQWQDFGIGGVELSCSATVSQSVCLRLVVYDLRKRTIRLSSHYFLRQSLSLPACEHGPIFASVMVKYGQTPLWPNVCILSGVITVYRVILTSDLNPKDGERIPCSPCLFSFSAVCKTMGKIRIL